MKKLLIALAFLLAPVAAHAQCTGIFPANTLCGNLSGTKGPPKPWTTSGSPIVNAAPGQVVGNGTASTAQPVVSNLTNIFDQAYCNTVGYVVARFTGSWTCAKQIPIRLNWLGADPTGATDLGPLLNSTIAANPTSANMQLDPGSYCISTLVNFGNGTASVSSTQTGIYLFGIADRGGTTQLSWCGGSLSGQSMIHVKGVSGWGLKNLLLAGPGTVGTALEATGAAEGDVQNVFVANFLRGIVNDSFVSSGGQSQNADNYWNQVTVEVPNTAGAVGWLFDGQNTDNSTNSCCQVVVNAGVDFDGTSAAAVAFQFRKADSVVMINPTVNGCGGSNHGVELDYSGGNGWPNDITFFMSNACDTINNSSPTSSSPNRWFGVGDTNGNTYPTIPGVQFPAEIVNPGFDATSQTGSISPTNLDFSNGSQFTGFFNICVSLGVTQTGTGGATIAWGVQFTDPNFGVRTVTVASGLVTSATTYSAQCVPIYQANSTHAQVFTTVTGTIGTAQYAIHARLERMY